MPTFGSRGAPTRDARLVAIGLVLVAAAAVLALSDGPNESAVLALAVGAGLCASAPLVVRRSRLRAALLIALLTAFVAWRLGALVAASAVSLASVSRLVTEGLIVGIVYELAYSHAQGLAQVATLFRGHDAGYAFVLDEVAVARNIELELARSRRHGNPLTLLVFEPTVGEPVPAFDAAMRRVSSSAHAELERLYVQQRGCRLISEQVRRSDVVGCSSADRFVVLSTDSDAAGTAVLASRVVDSVRAELGVELRPGIAEFPTDGSTYGDLVAVATSEALGNVAPVFAIRPVVGSVGFDTQVSPHIDMST